LKELGVKQLAYIDANNNIAIPHVGIYKNTNGGKIKKAE
jgi:hypothetical protein